MDDPKALPARLHHGRDNTLRGSGGEIISEGWRVRRGEPVKESLPLAVPAETQEWVFTVWDFFVRLTVHYEQIRYDCITETFPCILISAHWVNHKERNIKRNDICVMRVK